MDSLKGELSLFLVPILWGMGFVASVLGIEAFSVLELLSLRFWVASLLLSVVFFKSFKTLDKTNIKYGAILGILLFLAFYFQTVGLTHTTASKNAFLTSTNVVIVPLIGYLLYKRKVDKYVAIGAVLTLIGIGFISYTPELTVNIGDLLTLVGAAFFALHIFYIGDFNKKDTDPTKLTIVQMYTVAICSTVCLLFTDFSFADMIAQPNFKSSMLAVLYLGVFSTAICFYLQTLGQKYVSESKSAIILSTEAIFGAIFSAIFLHEILPPTTIIGCIIVFIAVLFTELKPNWFGLKNE